MEWENLIGSPCMVLDCLNVLLHSWDVFISSTAVEAGKPWSNGFKFWVSQDGFDMEATVLIETSYGLDLVDNGGNHIITECFHSPKVEVPGDGNPEGNLVDEHDISHQGNSPMDFHDVRWHHFT